MASTPDTMRGVALHVRELLARLHAQSKAQEAVFTPASFRSSDVHEVMRDQLIALDEDKCHYVYQLLRATGATTIVEAGTSFGVSTIYLALAAVANAAAAAAATDGTKKTARVVATEHEPTKAARAREHWRACGAAVEAAIELREGDLLETLKTDVDDVDFLLLDIWSAMALPTLKLVQPKLRHGAVVVADNTVSGAEGYRAFLAYVRAPGSGFVDTTLPFAGGLEVLVYVPKDGAVSGSG